MALGKVKVLIFDNFFFKFFLNVSRESKEQVVASSFFAGSSFAHKCLLTPKDIALGKVKVLIF